MLPRPQAKEQGIVEQALDDGTVIYDGATHQAHWLNAAATLIWSLADGTRTVAEITAEARIDHEAVVSALERLEGQGLLLDQPSLSRRSLLRRTVVLGAGALAAAPLIETLVIPVAAAHASTGPPPQNGPQVTPQTRSKVDDPSNFRALPPKPHPPAPKKHTPPKKKQHHPPPKKHKRPKKKPHHPGPDEP